MKDVNTCLLVACMGEEIWGAMPDLYNDLVTNKVITEPKDEDDTMLVDEERLQEICQIAAQGFALAFSMVAGSTFKDIPKDNMVEAIRDRVWVYMLDYLYKKVYEKGWRIRVEINVPENVSYH